MRKRKFRRSLSENRALTCRLPNAHGAGREDGVILLLTLFVVTLLSIIVLEFSYTTRVEYHIAGTYRDELLAMSIARAGVEESIALLRKDRIEEVEEREEEDEEKGISRSMRRELEKREKEKKEKLDEKRRMAGGLEAREETEFPDHYGEDWAQERYLTPFGEGLLTVKVIDESGKININSLMKEIEDLTDRERLEAEREKQQKTGESDSEEDTEELLEEEKIRLPRRWGQKDEDRTGEKSDSDDEEEDPYEKPRRYTVDRKVEKDILRMLETLNIRDVEPEEVVAAMVDWMDSNDDGEWEDDAYGKVEGVELPKNAPLDVLSELLMVEGVTGDLFFGPKRPEEICLEEEMSDAARRRARRNVGLRDCLTVHSEVKVNVNTASAEVLTSLLEEENESLVKEIVSHTKDDYFEDLKEFEEEIGEHIPASFMAKIGVGSDSFQIVAEARVAEALKRIRAYVRRDEEGNVKILQWRVEG